MVFLHNANGQMANLSERLVFVIDATNHDDNLIRVVSSEMQPYFEFVLFYLENNSSSVCNLI